jgi:hypothetical protein
MRNEAHKRFYRSRKKKFMNPLRVLRKAHTIEEMRYCMKLAGVGPKLLGVLTEEKK